MHTLIQEFSPNSSHNTSLHIPAEQHFKCKALFEVALLPGPPYPDVNECADILRCGTGVVPV